VAAVVVAAGAMAVGAMTVGRRRLKFNATQPPDLGKNIQM